jgi:hypothetical protein
VTGECDDLPWRLYACSYRQIYELSFWFQELWHKVLYVLLDFCFNQSALTVSGYWMVNI